MALLILIKYRKCETVRCEKCYQIQIKREYGSEENAKRRGSVHMKKRLISLLLSVAVLTTSVPVSTFADPSAGQEPAVSSEESQERGIDYKKTGELFRRTIRLLRNIRLLSCRERKTSENRGMNSVDGTTTRN